MLEQLIHLMWLGLITTSLDVDNAVYMTSVVQTRPQSQQRRLITWGLIAEYIGRLLLIMVAYYLASGQETLFSIGEFSVTPQVIALLLGGGYVFWSSTTGLVDYFDGKTEEKPEDAAASFTKVLIQMTAVNLILSIDTTIAVASMTKSLLAAGFILLISAVIRFLFIDRIAKFMSEHQQLQIVVLTFMSLIGLQLITKAFYKEIPDAILHLVIAASIIVALIAKRRASRRGESA